MKKYKLLAIPVTAGIMMLSGCADKISPQDGTQGISRGKDLISVTAETPTRTELSPKDGGYEVLWCEGDGISVLGADGGNTTFVLASGSGTAGGTFEGDLSKAGEEPYFIVYPADPEAKVQDGQIVFNIKPDAGKLPSVARLEMDKEVPGATLRNLFGALKITLTSNPQVSIRKITLHDLAGNTLWGTCSVPLDNGFPKFGDITVSEGDNSISLVSATSFEIGEDGKTFFFPVPAGTLDHGFSAVLYEYDEAEENSVGRTYSVVQKVSSPVAAQRSSVVSIAASALKEKSEPKEIKARGYYKSLFVCAGCFLSNYYTPEHIPTIAALGLENDYEYIATASRADLNGSSSVKETNVSGQNAVMVSSPQDGMTDYSDYNGTLLYPDGEPRFRAMFVNGGTSYTFGPTLTDKGRQQIHDWYLNGGSYIGVCAGTFLATTSRDGTNRWNNSDPSKNYSFGIWPGNLGSTSVPVDIFKYPAAATGAKILEDYANFNHAADFAAKHGLSGRAWECLSPNDTIEDIDHQGGSFLPHSATNAAFPHEEFVAMQWSGPASIAPEVPNSLRYLEEDVGVAPAFKSSRKVHDSTIVWAYKKDSKSGRAVLSGSHPEKRGPESGRNFNLMANMILHALEGVGEPEVKGELTLDGVRKMNRTTADNDPDYARIGDRQYHHFILDVPSAIQNFKLELISDYASGSGIDLYLTMRKDDFAWISDADYAICTKGGQKSLEIKELPAGRWYVGVYCATTVDATEFAYDETTGPFFFKYGGHTEVLDGIAYSISCETSADPGIPGIGTLPGHDMGSDKLDD